MYAAYSTMLFYMFHIKDNKSLLQKMVTNNNQQQQATTAATTTTRKNKNENVDEVKRL